MDIHPDDPVVCIDAWGNAAKTRVIACFENPDGIEWGWFTAGNSAFGMRDEGVTWVRGDSYEDIAALRAARRLQGLDTTTG